MYSLTYLQLDLHVDKHWPRIVKIWRFLTLQIHKFIHHIKLELSNVHWFCFFQNFVPILVLFYSGISLKECHY